MEIAPKNHEEGTLELGPQAFSKQSHQFWTLQITGWLGYSVVVFLAIIRPQIGLEGFNFSGQMINLVLETLSGFILSYLQWQLIRKIVHLPLKKTLFLSFVSAASLGLLFNEAWNTLEFGGWLMFSLTTMFVWTSIYFIMLYNTKLQGEHEMLLRAQTATKDAQLQMLRYQLNPHFMFNTLNAISTLIYKNENETANEMLDKLCEFFRYSLDKSDKSKTSLKKELELIELYLSIEKVRFGERLDVDIDVSSKALTCQVPCMLLQPLVENAIKYAIELRKSGGKICISAKQINDRLLLQVIDNGQESHDKVSDGFGIGLSNTKARLSAMFNGDFEVNITDTAEGGTMVAISIPFEKKV